MMDAIRKPKTRVKPVFESKPITSAPSQTPSTLPTPRAKPYSPEMKVWLSVVGSSLVIVGVWIATFSLPQSKPQDSDTSPSELKSILTELRDTMKTGLQTIHDQRAALSEQTKRLTPILSNDELTRLAEQLTARPTSTTATSTAPAIFNATTTPPAKLP